MPRWLQLFLLVSRCCVCERRAIYGRFYSFGVDQSSSSTAQSTFLPAFNARFQLRWNLTYADAYADLLWEKNNTRSLKNTIEASYCQSFTLRLFKIAVRNWSESGKIGAVDQRGQTPARKRFRSMATATCCQFVQVRLTLKTTCSA